MKKSFFLLSAIISAAIFTASCTAPMKNNNDNTTHQDYDVPASLCKICDSSKVAAHIENFPERWAAAFEYINKCLADGVDEGTYPVLDDGEVFAIVSEYVPRPADSCRFEAHRKYIDLQYLVSGREMMGITSPDSLTVLVPYVEDVEFYSPDGVDARYAEADSTKFFAFFPDDPHRPSIKCDDDRDAKPVKKIVVKILYDAK